MYEFREPTEIKLIILYIIKNYDEPIHNGQITDVFMSHAFVDYFSMQQYLNELVDCRLVEIERRDEVRYYFLSEIGEDAYRHFINQIPRTVREKILLTIRAYKKKLQDAMDVTADYKPINELEYAIDCAVKDGGFPLLELRMFTGSKETAREACKRFREAPQKVYAALLQILIDGETEKNNDATQNHA